MVSQLPLYSSMAHHQSHGTDRCELVLYPPCCATSLPRSPPGYLGGTSGTAIQIQLSPRRELRRSEADILRIISAKFCSPVRKFLMERVNGQEGRGCEVARGVTSVALLRTRLYLSLTFSCNFGLLNGQKRTQIKRIGFLSDIH